MSGANASPTGRSHQAMSGANASPTGRSHQAMSGANASPTGRSHQAMSGANASPTRSASAIARSLKAGRSHQEMKRALITTAVLLTLALVPLRQADAQPPAAAQHRALVNQYRVTCHNDKLKTVDLM